MSPVFPPERLAAWTDGRWTGRPSPRLAGFSVDSRSLAPGQVFVALKTGKRDGHDFVAASAAAGAGGAMVSRIVPSVDLPQLLVADPLLAFQKIAGAHRREFQKPVIGITGSAGKTSTKNLLADLLGGSGVLSTEGNLNNHLGVPLTLTRLDPAAHGFAVVEAGIGAVGEMAPLAEMIAPDIAIVTFVGPAHLAGLGGMEGVACEKARLAASVRPGGLAIFPSGCLDFAAFRSLRPRTITLTRAAGPLPRSSPPSKVFFTAEVQGDTTLISMAHRTPATEYRLHSVSAGMAQNAALALCAALELGIPAELVQARLLEWRPSPMRGEFHRRGGRLFYVDCYNANPASMADALAAFQALAPAGAPRLLVVGCMEELGAEAAALHAELGRRLGLRGGDRLLLIGEHAASVRAGALEAGVEPGSIRIVETLEPIAESVASFEGSVFLKASRRYRLEDALGAAVECDRQVGQHA